MLLTTVLSYFIMSCYQKIRIKLSSQEFRISSVFAKVLILSLAVVISILSSVDFQIHESYLPLSFPFVLLRYGNVCIMYFFNAQVFVFSLRYEPWFDFTNLAPYYFFVYFLFINLFGAIIGALFVGSEPRLHGKVTNSIMMFIFTSFKAILVILALFLILRLNTRVSILVESVSALTIDSLKSVSTICGRIMNYAFKLFFSQGVLSLNDFCVLANPAFLTKTYFFLIPLYFYLVLAIMEYNYLLQDANLDKIRRTFYLDFLVLMLLVLLFYWSFDWNDRLLSNVLLSQRTADLLTFLFSWEFGYTLISLSEALPSLVGWALVAYLLTSDSAVVEPSAKKKLREVLTSLYFVVFPLLVYSYHIIVYSFPIYWCEEYILNLILQLSVWLLMLFYILAHFRILKRDTNLVSPQV